MDIWSRALFTGVAILIGAGGITSLEAQVPEQAAPAGGAHGRGYGGVRAYAHDVLGVGAWIGVAAGSGLDEARTDPTEWGTGVPGYGRRFASRGGHLVVQETARHLLAAALGRSTQYVRCGCQSVGGRFANAFRETLTDTDARGERAFSVPRVGGAFAGSFATMLWRPHATAAGAARDGIVGLLFTVGGNVLKEYVHWPS